MGGLRTPTGHAVTALTVLWTSISVQVYRLLTDMRLGNFQLTTAIQSKVAHELEQVAEMALEHLELLLHDSSRAQYRRNADGMLRVDDVHLEERRPAAVESIQMHALDDVDRPDVL